MTQLAEPKIAVLSMDYDRLCNVAESASRSAPDIAEFLLHELDRATIVAPGRKTRAVQMDSHVNFRDEASGRVQAVQLVYPAQADPAAGRISVLTPIGAALIGLSAGQTMQWRDRRGEIKALTVLGVQDELTVAG